MQTQGNSEERLVEKFRLTRRLYEQGLKRKEILNFYKFIDWVMTLPNALEIRYNEAVYKLGKEPHMTYITSAERIGMQKGYEKGIAEGREEAERAILDQLLRYKFQNIPAHYQEKISRMDTTTLLTLITRVMKISSVEEIFDDNG